MRAIKLAALTLLIASLACSIPSVSIGSVDTVQGSGSVVEETRSVQGFSSFTLSGIGNVHIEQGQDEALVIEAEDNLLEYLTVRVDRGELEIGIREGVNLRPHEPINIYLSVINLDSIRLSGSGDVQASTFEANSLELALPGSGRIAIDQLTATDVGVTLSGSGEIELAGEVVRQDLNISGSGDYRARDLASSSAEIHIGGSGSALVQVDDQLDIVISGSGSVSYIGTPNVSQSVTGSGSISQLGE